MKPYPKYKDSGVEWIGEVPEGWEVLRLKWICSFLYGESLSAQEREDGAIPVYGSNGIVGYHNRSITEKPCIIVGRKGSFGKVTFSEKKCYPIDTTYYIDCTSTKNYMHWLWYLLPLLKMDEFSRDSAVPGLNREDAYRNIVTLPSSYEQKQIAAYLDRKTTQIDNLISKKQKLIELLKEERSAIINQAVTKGLNPDEPMKDSGVEWLGEVPAHWEVKRLKYIARITLGKMLTNIDKGGYHYRPYLRAQNINWEKVNVKDVKNMWFSKDELQHYRLNKNDLLVSEGGEAGRTGIWDEEIEECYIQNSVHKVTMEPTNDPFFFLYTFCLFGQKGVFESVVSRISIAHLTKEKLKETVFPVPPNDEQERISKFIGTETTKIDQTISKIAKQIDLLQEYSTALISGVVTGKIDVRDEGLNG